MTPQEYEQAARYLARFYGAQVFEREGARHPISVYLPDDMQRASVDSMIGTLKDSSAERHAIYDYGYLQSVQNSGRNVYNGRTYVLHHLTTHPLRLHGQYGHYFDMLATCAALENELRASVSTRLIRLPLRTQLHRSLHIPQALWSGAGRSAAIGGACLVVFNDHGVYKAILAQRSASNATDPGFYHVMPAFIFQPTQAAPHPLDWRISHHIFREFLEELFGLPETDAPPEALYQHPIVVDLQRMLARGSAALRATGIAVNLLTLRPEICAVLVIHEADWWERVNNPASEYRINAASEAQGGRLNLVPVSSDEAILAALPQPLYTHMPPQGYTALWLGVDETRRLLAET